MSVIKNFFLGLFSFIDNMDNQNPDPVKHCQVYRTIGCTHVDGPLCDVTTCKDTYKVEISPRDKRIINIAPVEASKEEINENRLVYNSGFHNNHWNKNKDPIISRTK